MIDLLIKDTVEIRADSDLFAVRIHLDVDGCNTRRSVQQQSTQKNQCCFGLE